ncbi:MAG: T9SS type A sorting domain-containing protein [Bacteroidetes bacterium]|nr:T9SS type A sorting domain-containing protein [Bacteroidota bacterium]
MALFSPPSGGPKPFWIELSRLLKGVTLITRRLIIPDTLSKKFGYILAILPFIGLTPMAWSQQRIAPEVVNVVALMVEFQPDSSRFTTGNGTFDGPLFKGVEAPRLDPLPHDDSYFSAHLRFLEHYIAKVSDGRTEVKSFVLPHIIRVSHEMGYYSPTGKEAGGDPELSKLARMVKEAWTAAESQNVQLPPGITSSNTAFVLFHAGVGRDIELLGTTLDKTPEDLPSLYLGSETLSRLGAGSLIVDGVSVTNTMVIPRTESRLGFDFIAEKPFLIELSINGLLAASFLNYLGVPDLFNSQTGESAIGPFDVMDALGIFAFGGLFPPEPSAWTKQFVGWAEVNTFQDATLKSISLRHSGDASRNEVAKVPISDSEYFLLENRHRDPENDGIRMQVWKDGVTSEVVFPNADPKFNDVTISGFEGGVVVAVDQYDFALPGGEDEFGNPLVGGILIWHIDENRIREGILTNRVNADPASRGIDLEEADSGQDIGFSSNGGLFGPRFDLGSPFDFWFQSNPVKIRTTSGREIALYENRFATDTFPSSHGNNGTSSSISISNISDPGPEMTFILDQNDSSIWKSESQQMVSFPSGPISGESTLGLLPSTSSEPNPFVFGGVQGRDSGLWTAQTPYRGVEAIRPITGPFGLIAVQNDALVWIDASGLLRSASFGATGGSGRPTSNLAWYAEGSQYHVRLGVMLPSGPVMAHGIIGPNQSFTVSLETVSAPVKRIVQRSRSTATAFILIGNELLDEATGRKIDLELPVIAGNDLSTAFSFDVGLDRDGWMVAYTNPVTSTLQIVHESGERFTTSFSACVPGHPVFADLSLDARGDVLVSCGDELFGFHANGVLMGGFPFKLKGAATSEPIFVEQSGSSLKYAMVQTDLGNLDGFALGQSLQRIEGFPLSIGSPSETAPFVWDNHILTLSGNGTLKTWSTIAGASLSSRNIVGRDLAYVMINTPPDKTVSGTLLTQSETYNWPNPISEGRTHIRFMTTEASEVVVTIVDTTGQLVEKFESVSTIGGLPAEIMWTTGAQSGVYIARVQARAVGGSKSDTRLIKMAIVR